MSKKWVYLFDELEQAQKCVGGDWEAVRALLGGKGANLAEMVRIRIPVPPGFTVTTEACNAYLAAGESFPEGMGEQELDALKAIEAATGKKFGDRRNSLLVSCRSGAKISMPGMMDTVLNIGLNDEIADYAEFLSFGTNDLTQTTYGISRDDAEAGFLVEYISRGILPENPFGTIEWQGAGELMRIAITKGRAKNSDLECGICGEHRGDPESIRLCHELNLNYVSCSPLRVPIARLAAAHAAIRASRQQRE